MNLVVFLKRYLVYKDVLKTNFKLIKRIPRGSCLGIELHASSVLFKTTFETTVVSLQIRMQNVKVVFALATRKINPREEFNKKN